MGLQQGSTCVGEQNRTSREHTPEREHGWCSRQAKAYGTAVPSHGHVGVFPKCRVDRRLWCVSVCMWRRGAGWSARHGPRHSHRPSGRVCTVFKRRDGRGGERGGGGNACALASTKSEPGVKNEKEGASNDHATYSQTESASAAVDGDDARAARGPRGALEQTKARLRSSPGPTARARVYLTPACVHHPTCTPARCAPARIVTPRERSLSRPLASRRLILHT